MDKPTARRALRNRPPVTPSESSRVVAHLREWLAERPASRVLVFLPMKGEVDATPLIDDRHEWFTTRTPGAGAPLTVHSIHAPRERHRLGYEQPVATAERIDPASLDIVLTPSLSFAKDGRRLGWGMGYYDRLFAEAPGVVAVGITLDRLLADDVPTEDHDRQMDWLATDSGVRQVRRTR